VEEKISERVSTNLCSPRMEYEDYLNMYKDYAKLGVERVAFGGLVRKPTSYTSELITRLAREIETSRIVPGRSTSSASSTKPVRQIC